jgi:hypothetical protein
MSAEQLSVKVTDAQGGNYGDALQIDNDDDEDFIPTHDSCFDKDSKTPHSITTNLSALTHN